MTAGPVPSFEDFFRDVNGWDPFPWQSALAEQICKGLWPEVIDVPTGLGKTSVIDAALYALARDADVPINDRRARSRVVFVVNRRLIVDSAFEHAVAIRDRLVTATSGPAAWAREQLLRVGGGAQPLSVRRMRGGLTWSSLWAESPAQPLVLTATVDQFGSRFLFRGYGTTDWIKPIDAGLLATDCVVLLDEAHLAAPLVETLTSCALLESRAPDAPLPNRRSLMVQMTATPTDPTDSLISDHDVNHDVAGARLRAVKNAFLFNAEFATSQKSAATDAGRTLAKVAVQLVKSGEKTVMVTANTVAAARAAFEAVRDAKVETALVVGRCRPIDRDVNQRHWFDRTRTGRPRSSADPPFVLVATQAVEVGVDIDVDALVTEVAPIDSLVQRFGRVDRRGELGETRSAIIRFPSRLKDDPLPYGPASGRTWDWLAAEADVGDLGQRAEAVFTASPFQMGTLTVRGALNEFGSVRELVAPAQLPPVVLSSAVEAWRRTSPIPSPDETVAPYLHGQGRDEATVSLFWRCDATAQLHESRPIDQVLAPSPHELVEVSLVAAKRFLSAVEPADSTDLDAAEHIVDADPRSVRPAHVRRGERWEVIADISSLKPGDVVMVPSAAGGHDRWSFTGTATQETLDVAELTADRTFLRLDKRVISNLIGRSLSEDEANLLRVAADDEERGTDRREAVKRFSERILLSDLDQCVYAAEVRSLFEAFATATTIRFEIVGPPDEGAVVARRKRDALDASDDGNESSRTASSVSLDSHLESVGERAMEFAMRCGVEQDAVGAVTLAARFHDLGKADVRFQALLAGGPIWLVEGNGPAAGELLAKGDGGSGRAASSIESEARWPPGYRHEAISLALVESAPDSVFEGVDRELVEHLVAAHHGRARPLFPPVGSSTRTTVEVDFSGIEFRAVADDSHPGWSQPGRFDRLCARYGSWGLAYLEAIVRLADIAVSREGQ